MNQSPKYSAEFSFATARRSLKPVPSLTPFERYRENPTKQLRDVLVEANWGLCVKAAERAVKQCSEPFEDLMQAGSLGLIKAVERFDPSLVNAFSSFAMPFIQGAIMHYLRDHGYGLIRLSRRDGEVYAKIKGAQRRLVAMGREMSTAAVAEGFGIPKSRWEFIEQARERPRPVSLDESPIEIEDPTPVAEEDRGWVFEYLANLPDATRGCVIEHVFKGMTVEAIAKQRGLTPEITAGLITSGLEAMKVAIEVEGHHGNDD